MLRYANDHDTHHIDFVHWIGLQCIPPDRCLFDIFKLYKRQRNKNYQLVLAECFTGWSIENIIRSAPTAVMALTKSGVEKCPDVVNQMFFWK